MVDSAKAISESFLKNRENSVIGEDYYPAQLSVLVKTSVSDNPAKVDSSATVILGNDAQNVFGLKRPDWTWEELEKRLEEKVEGTGTPLWMLQLQKEINNAADDVSPMPTSAIMYSTKTQMFYKPQLTRQIKYLNGDRRYYIVLCEQPSVDFVKHSALGTLLASLIVGGRFKFDFLSPNIGQVQADFSDEDFTLFCRTMRNQISTIEIEAAQHGLLDPTPNVDMYDRRDQETIKGMYIEWGKIRSDLFRLLDSWERDEMELVEVKNELADILRLKLEPMNSKFMQMAVERYYQLAMNEFRDGNHP